MWRKNRLFSILNNKKIVYITLAVIGLCLVFISYSVQDNSLNNYVNTSNYEYANAYGTYLEEKTQNILATASGCNNVKVMITFKNMYDYTVKNNVYDNTFSAFEKTDKKSNPTEVKYPEIAGVMIVCKGITSQNDFAVLKQAVSTLLNISQNKIYIVGG